MAELTNSAIASLVHSSLSPRPRARALTSSPALCLPGTLQRENSWANTKHLFPANYLATYQSFTALISQLIKGAGMA